MSLKSIISKLPTYWKLSSVRCFIYTLTVGWGVFKAGTNGFTTLRDMTNLQMIDLIGDVVVSMLIVWVAFLDQTINTISKQQTTESK